MFFIRIGTSSRALLFELPYADFKLNRLSISRFSKLPSFSSTWSILASSRPIPPDRRESGVDFRKFLVHVASEIGDFHARLRDAFPTLN